jgi:hypothetical protein
MAQKKADDAATAILVIVLLLVVLLLVAAPVVLMVGWRYYSVKVRKRIAGLAGTAEDFWLDARQRAAFRNTARREAALGLELGRMLEEAEARGLSRNKDGSYSRRSKLGKDINRVVGELHGLRDNMSELAALPRHGWDKFNHNIRACNGFRAGLLGWLISWILLPIGFTKIPLLASLEAYGAMFGAAEMGDVHFWVIFLPGIIGLVALAVGWLRPRTPALQYSPEPATVTADNVMRPEIRTPMTTSASPEPEPSSAPAEAAVGAPGTINVGATLGAAAQEANTGEAGPRADGPALFRKLDGPDS